MAVDLTTSNKPLIGAVYPEGVKDTPQSKIEPLITPEQLRTRHLFGIPLAIKDPFTNKINEIRDEQLKDIIQGAVEQAEIESDLDIMPVQRVEKAPWDYCDYRSFGYMRTEHRPVSALQQLEVSPPDNSTIYVVPLEWIEVARLACGQINIIPLLAAVSGNTSSTTTVGASVFLSMFLNQTWIADFWKITYTSGFPDGLVPRVVNELIGTIAAMEVLSMLAAAKANFSSVSLGIDGMSQSVGTPGPQIYRVRLEELENKRARLAKKIKSLYGQTLFSGQI